MSTHHTHQTSKHTPQSSAHNYILTERHKRQPVLSTYSPCLRPNVKVDASNGDHDLFYKETGGVDWSNGDHARMNKHNSEAHAVSKLRKKGLVNLVLS